MTWSSGWEAALGVLGALGMVVAWVAFAHVGAWLDRRASTTREQALDDLRRDGPLAPGLRVDLLPPEVRAEVAAARRAAGATERPAGGERTRPTGHPPVG